MKPGNVLGLAVCFLFVSVLGAVGQKKPDKLEVQAYAKDSKDSKDKDKEKARAQEKAGKALMKWLDEVSYIITPAEEKVFKLLKTDEERENFIEQFWLHRDPTPDTADNEYRDEFYERIAYANDHFAAGLPGWKTDRGHIYVTYGAPDEVETHATGGGYQRTEQEGGGFTTTFPFERWRYHHMDGIPRQNVILEFVDDCNCSEYRLTADPSAKDAMLHVPGGGLYDGESAFSFSRQRICNMQGVALLGNCTGVMTNENEFDKLLNYNEILKPPPIKYASLAPSVTTKILTNILPFDLRADFIKVTDATVHTPITLQFSQKDLAFKESGGAQSATVHILGEVRDVSNRLIRRFEDPARSIIPSNVFSTEVEKPLVYQANLYLNPGRLYSIYIAIEDVNGGNIGTIKQRLQVPAFPEEGLTLSSLILADKIEPLSARSISPDSRFTLGDHYVRPSVKREFQQNQTLKIWTQAYGVKVDDKLHKPSASFEILVMREGKEVRKIVEKKKDFSSAAQQLTIVKSIPLAEFSPGAYTIQMKVTDNLSKDTVTSSEKFTVRSKP